MIVIKLTGSDEVIELGGESAELEQESPLFSTADSFTGEYSTAVRIPYTESNSHKLGYPFAFYTKRIKKRTPADFYDGTHFRKRGFLITENGRINQNNITESELNGYFLFGLSNFYQIVKDVKLRSLKLGGVRRFNHTTFDPYDNSGGFWQYLHSTWDGDKDFLVAPIRNTGIVGDDSAGTPDFLNPIDYKKELDSQKCLDFDCLVPQIRVKYIVDSIFTEFGYTPTWEINDQLFERLFMVSLMPFQWKDYSIRPVLGPLVPSTLSQFLRVLRWLKWDPKPEIEVKLADHLPDNTINDFLVNLQNAYGFRFLINDVNKTVRIIALKNVRNGKRKDWTPFIMESLETNFSDEGVWGFRMNVDGNDSFPVQNSLEGFTKLPSVQSFNDLPAPAADYFNQICYAFLENTWYICLLNESNAFEWQIHADNITEFRPDGENNRIETSFSSLPVINTAYRTNQNQTSTFFAWLPAMKQEVYKEFGYRTLFYHGIVFVAPSGDSYPALSNLYWIPQGGPENAWSNVPTHELGNNKYGIAHYWYRDWLDILSNYEEITFNFNMPRHELDSFQWDDVILINNIPFLVKTITEPIPYNGVIQAVLRRIG